MLFGNFDRNLGPRYLIECLPYFTELNLGIVKSDCLKLYVLGLLLKKISYRDNRGITYVLTLYIKIERS